MTQRLKARWTILTAKDFLLVAGKSVIGNGDQATKTAYALIALKRTYDETSEVLKPYVKEVAMTTFMPFGEAMKSLTDNLANAVNDLSASLDDRAKEDALKEEVSPAPKKRSRKK